MNDIDEQREPRSEAPFRHIIGGQDMKERIIRNANQCRHCGDVIESKSVHDFVTCSCGACSVDGGHEYLRRCFISTPEQDYREMSEVEPRENRGY